MGTYTSIEKVSNLLQVDLSDSTWPRASAVEEWITEVEAEILERALGSHVATGLYLNVPNNNYPFLYYEPIYYARTQRLIIHLWAGSLVPITDLKAPIVSIQHAYINYQDPMQAPNWVEVLEGPAAGASFILLQSGIHQWGYFLWFYNNMPLQGYKRVKLDYTYDWQINNSILVKWATLRTAILAMESMRGTSRDPGLSEFSGGDLGTFVPNQYRDRINSLKAECTRLEDEYFPRPFVFGVVR